MPIVVVDYDPQWPLCFAQLRDRIWPVLSDIASTIEHVGSTAVPGLAAKPVIDMDIVLPGPAQIQQAIERLARLGYEHRGNQGIEGREAFRQPAGLPPHHLYACVADSLALANHLAVRDALRADPVLAARYGSLKKRLAGECAGDIDTYVAGKTGLLLDILQQAGLSGPQLEAIAQANRGLPAIRPRDTTKPAL
ncbi:MAG: GrpB family protein [Moraxellaceae bacterium]|nr:GrpB family protein [Moraxellaceae bacterium]